MMQDNTNVMMPEYPGYKMLHLTDEECIQLFEDNTLDNYSFLENEYLIIVPDEETNDLSSYAYYQFQKGRFKPIHFSTIDSRTAGAIAPRNPQQLIAINMLQNCDTTLKLVTGTFGTGKTMLLVTAALEAIEHNKFEKIVWVRNNVQVRDTDPLGALPGDSYEKLLPYLGPMMDHVGGEIGIETLIHSNQLEVIPLAHLRGRSLRNSIIISSEAENLTKEHLQLLIGRVDEGSNLWIDADLKQRDRTIFEKSRGIERLIDGLKGEPLFEYVHLIKSERSETARLADKLN